MRATADAIRQKRQSRDTTILFTGATGFLGSHLIVEFMRKNYNLVLIFRPGARRSAQQRWDQLLEWFGLNTRQWPRVRVFEGYPDRPRFGMAREIYSLLLEEVEEIFNCAADTSFAERKRPRIEAANIQTAKNVMAFSSHGRVDFVHHLSTAYVAGKKRGPCVESLIDTDEFHNIYEETKYKAEKYLWHRCAECGIRLNIYRPSIVCGNSKTGKTFRFNALYFPVKLFQYFRDLYLVDIQENEGASASKMGIKRQGNGAVFLPIRIKKTLDGMLNIIPVDFFIQAALAIWEHSLEGGIFHIVNDHPKSLDELINYLQHFLNVRGIRGVIEDVTSGESRTPLEVLVDSYLEVYRPYMMDTRTFLNDRTSLLLTKQNVNCPDLDYTVFERCMTYAVKKEWGKKI